MSSGPFTRGQSVGEPSTPLTPYLPFRGVLDPVRVRRRRLTTSPLLPGWPSRSVPRCFHSSLPHPPRTTPDLLTLTTRRRHSSFPLKHGSWNLPSVRGPEPLDNVTRHFRVLPAPEAFVSSVRPGASVLDQLTWYWVLRPRLHSVHGEGSRPTDQRLRLLYLGWSTYGGLKHTKESPVHK